MRGFGDGFAIIILPAYLTAVGYTPAEIGMVATASLLGTALLTLAVGFFAPHHDMRNLLIVGAALMTCTGIAFPQFEQIAHDLDCVVLRHGQSVDRRPRRPGAAGARHAGARRVRPASRTKVFARYSLIGALSMAAGALAASLPDWAVHAGIGKLDAFRLMFYLYGVLGIVSAALYRRLPHAEMEEKKPSAPLGPSRGVVYRLAALFCIDAFAGGFVVQSLLALWLFERFDLSLSVASVFFFWASVLSAFSFPVAAWLAGRIGLVNTMVYTHIPSEPRAADRRDVLARTCG